MIDEKICEYIRQELGKGIPLEKIKKVLLEVGHDKDIVNENIQTFTIY